MLTFKITQIIFETKSSFFFLFLTMHNNWVCRIKNAICVSLLLLNECLQFCNFFFFKSWYLRILVYFFVVIFIEA